LADRTPLVTVLSTRPHGCPNGTPPSFSAARLIAEHGNVERALDADLSEAERILAQAAGSGVDLPTVTAELEREGVASFCDSLPGAARLHPDEALRGSRLTHPARKLRLKSPGLPGDALAWLDRVLAVALSGGASQRRASRRPLCVLGGV
jgi:hypothetical protein